MMAVTAVGRGDRSRNGALCPGVNLVPGGCDDIIGGALGVSPFEKMPFCQTPPAPAICRAFVLKMSVSYRLKSVHGSNWVVRLPLESVVKSSYRRTLTFGNIFRSVFAPLSVTAVPSRTRRRKSPNFVRCCRPASVIFLEGENS